MRRLTNLDYEEIYSSLLSKHNIPKDYVNDLPQIGYGYVDENNTLIAMGFIRQAEGGYGFLEALTSNPEFSSEKRHEALTKLVDHLLYVANSIGLKAIFAFTQENDIVNRSLKHNFKVTNQTLIVRKL